MITDCLFSVLKKSKFRMSVSKFRHKISQELSEDVGFMLRWEAFYNSLDFKDSSIPVKGRSYRQECATAYDLISWILELWTARKTEKVATVENLVGNVAELGFPVLASVWIVCQFSAILSDIN